MSLNLGINLTEHAVGILIKEMVQRAIKVIRKNRFIFEVHSKPGYDGQSEDLFTNADRAAQNIYTKLIQESFPGCGIIAEEDELSIPCKIPGRDIYFVVDPLDGTKAFTRRQSHGVGTMIALIDDGEIISSFVGDVMTQEIYGYRPKSKRVYRLNISDHDEPQILSIKDNLSLSEQYVLLQDDPREYSNRVQQLTCKKSFSCIFRGTTQGSGSIGIMLAQLWKGEVGAAILKPSAVTPWDTGPIRGISQQLGFVTLVLSPRTNLFVKADCTPKKTVVFEEAETLIIHKSRLSEISHILE